MASIPLLQIRDRSWAFDIALCMVVAVATVAPTAASGAPLLVALALALVLPLLIRRTLPGLALGVMFAAALGMVWLGSNPVPAIVAVPILIYSLARFTTLGLARMGLAAGLLGSLLGPARWALGYGLSQSAVILFVVTAAACAGIVTAAYLVGRRRREGVENTAARVQSAEERSRLLLADQEQRARMATVAERTRIARELHDIVAHSLSVIVVQAEGGRAMAARRPEQAAEVLGTIAETSREALQEMRQMVGLLRGEPGERAATAYVPTPGLDDIADLVRRTGDTVELSTFGSPPEVTPAVALSAYRIVQESLTNVLKHAGPAAEARVTLAYTTDAVEIEVTDNGRGAAARTAQDAAENDAGQGAGHGLRGMAERVALHGGELTAAPRPGGGFVVRASLPVDREPTIPLDLRQVSPG